MTASVGTPPTAPRTGATQAPPHAPAPPAPAVPAGRVVSAGRAVPAGRASAAAPTVWLVVAALAGLALALRVPVATTVLGLVLFGVLHNVLELRYVAGRFEQILAGPFLALLVALITGVAVCRLLPAGPATRSTEILLCYALLGFACVHTFWRRAPRHGSSLWLVGTGAALIGAAAVSLTFPSYHFVVLSHLHNVVPLFFLWEWSRTIARGRWAFRSVNLGWVLVVPALLLVGAFDPLLHATPASLMGFGGVEAFDPARLAAAYTPAAWTTTDMAVRFLAVFAFMQTMHYVVWIGVLPRFAPDATARFDARVPALRGGRAWLLGGGLAVALGVLFALDYAAGKSIYAAAASYHAYLEFPVLLALILGYSRPDPKGEPR